MRHLSRQREDRGESKKDLLIWVPVALALTLAGLHFLLQ